jgi:hypothetical protein
MLRRRLDWFCCAALIFAVLAVYSNHFENDFHFDDGHTIVNNPAIAHLANIPRFFTEPALFSNTPEGILWRPVVSVSLAFDYALGGGLKPFWFHLSTFIWFEVQLVLMFLLYRRIMDAADPRPSNVWTALAAAAIYGLHPVSAETVNYIIQRGDLYDALGTVAGLLLFAAFPRHRKFGWYLLPVMAAYLAKPSALVFPVVLLAYILLIEGKAPAHALRAALPAFAVTAVAAALNWKMTPPQFNPGADSPTLYCLTQPWVALRYFRCFFFPNDLSADSDWTYVSPFSVEAIAGYVFVAVLLAAAWRTARKRETAPIAFGILWFILALLPTALMPLAEVTNDHRMFFPFVGLALAVIWSVRLAILRISRPVVTRAAAVALVAVLAAAAWGTHQRNQVWHTEESFWRDVTVKSPKNSRGLLNYGITLYEAHDFDGALHYLELAAKYREPDANLEESLAGTYEALGRKKEAEEHYRRARELEQ